VKTKFANKVILFQETLEYGDAINLCYGRHETLELQGCVPDAYMWAVCKTLTKIMLPIVKKCILNQTCGYWLIFNTLHATFSISVSMQMEIQQFETTSSNFIRGGFEYEFQALQLHMMAKMMAILVLFWPFATTCTPNKAHNMLALMLDLCFKFLDVVKTFVQWGKVTEMVAEYEIKSLMPLVVVTFHLQNPSSINLIDALVVANEDSIFGPMTSNKATLQRLLKNELSLFHHLHVKLEHYLLPLTCWKSHEWQFPNISFVVRQIFGIPKNIQYCWSFDKSMSL